MTLYHLDRFVWRRAHRGPDPRIGDVLAFSAANLWNTSLADLYPSGVPIHADSASMLSVERQNKDSPQPHRDYLGTDVTQSTHPVYYVDDTTPLKPVRIWASWRYGNDNSVDGTYYADQVIQVPIPVGARPVGDHDYYVLIRHIDGREWGFWKVGHTDGGGSKPGLTETDLWVPQDIGGGEMMHACQSAALYQPDPANGVSGGIGGWKDGAALPSYVDNPRKWGQRGAKIPQTVGLVHPWEIEQGVIQHAIAYAFRGPSPDYVLPAQDSDGANFGGVSGLDMPEGARIRLKPDFDLTLLPEGAPRVIGQCLKDYGAICIDNAGYPKIYLEAEPTAGWRDQITPSSLSAAPLSAYEVVDWNAPYQ